MMQVVCFKARAEARGREPLTVGMSNAVTVGFDFSPEWAGLSKTAVFTNGKTTVDVLESQWADGVAADIPHEVLAEEGRRVQVGIYGTDGETVVLPTVWATLGVVLPAAEPSGDESTDPTLPVWAQLQKEIDGIGAPSHEDIAAAVEDYLAENPVEAPVTSVNGKTGDVKVSGEVKVVKCEDEVALCRALRAAFVEESAPYVINTSEAFPYTIYAPSGSATDVQHAYEADGLAVSSEDGAVYQYHISMREGQDNWHTFALLTKLTPDTALTVTFTVDGGGNYSADKTFAEVREAVQNGAVVTGRFNGIMFPLAFDSGDACSFVAGTCALDLSGDSTRTILFDDGGFFLMPNDTVSYVPSGIAGGFPLLLPSDIPTLDQIKDAVSLIVHVTESSDGTLTADKTYATITDALSAGNCVTCEVSIKARETATYSFAHAGYGYVAFGDAAEVIDDDGDDVPDGIFSHGGAVIYADDHVELREERGVTTLPSPHALTLTGAVEATYDGSEDVTVEIPEGGSDLGITGAEVGQTVKITAVDESGKPTAWEAVEMTGGGGEWEKIVEVTLEEEAQLVLEDIPADYKDVWGRLEVPYTGSRITMGNSQFLGACAYYSGLDALNYPMVFDTLAYQIAPGAYVHIQRNAPKSGVGTSWGLYTRANVEDAVKEMRQIAFRVALPAGTHLTVYGRK